MAFVVEPETFEFLAIAKELYDCGLMEKLPEYWRSMDICEDYYSLAWEGISRVFEDFNEYYAQETGTETMVFFDSLITEFYRLCRLYEAQKNILHENNSFWKRGEREIYECFYLNAYDYDVRLYDGSRGKPRMVILTGEEFCGHGELPGVLAEVRNTFASYCNQLKKALAAEKIGDIIFNTDTELPEKEAA